MTRSELPTSALRRGTAAGLAALVAGLYLVVGLEVVEVPGVAEVEPGPAVPLVIAGVLFAVLAAALAFRPSRLLEAFGALLCVAVLLGYVVVAPSRDPSYEAWGLTIKVLQLVLLGVLAYLAAKTGRHAVSDDQEAVR